MSNLRLRHPAFIVPAATSASGAATGRPPFRTRRKAPTIMPGTAAIAWLAQQQPALFAVLEQRLHAREGVAAGRGVAATAAELETACQMIAQFLQQVGRQQPLGVIPMSDLDQAALRPADADPSILAWIQTYKETAGEVAVAHVSAPVSAEIARVMQQVVGILLDPLSSMQTA